MDYPMINEVIFFLNKADPTQVRELKKLYPKQKHIFAEVSLWGEKDADINVGATSFYAASLAVMEKALEKADGVLTELRQKIVLARRISLFSNVVTLLGSGGTVAFLFGSDSHLGSGMAAGITLTASFLALISKYFTETWNGNSASNVFEELVGASTLGKLAYKKADYLLHAYKNDERNDKLKSELDQTINVINDIFAKINRLNLYG
jgi:hypothetical protein